MTHTYLFTNPQDHTAYLGSVIDALTGRETALFSDARGAVVVDENLCSGCDSPVSDGPCGCMTTPDGRLIDE